MQPALVDTGGQRILQANVQTALFPGIKIFALVIRVFVVERLTNISKYHPPLPIMLYHSDSSAIVVKGLYSRKNLSNLLMC